MKNTFLDYYKHFRPIVERQHSKDAHAMIGVNSKTMDVAIGSMLDDLAKEIRELKAFKESVEEMPEYQHRL